MGNWKNAGESAINAIFAIMTLEMLVVAEKKQKEWANSQYIDWSEVPVDTPILVRDSELFAWSKEHFAKYEDETVYTWDYGKTSWSTYDGKMSSYKYAMLPESEDQNENKQN